MEIFGLIILLAHAIFYLAVIGLVIWLLVTFASAIFKVIWYGFVTVLAFIGLVWLLL